LTYLNHKLGIIQARLDPDAHCVCAKDHAKNQLASFPSSQKEKDNLMFTRVTGFLLIKFFEKYTILSPQPCTSLTFKNLSPLNKNTIPTSDQVFKFGKWYNNYFTHMCAFDSSPMLFRISVFFANQTSTKKYPPPTRHSSFSSFDSLKTTAQSIEPNRKSCMAAKGSVYISHSLNPLCSSHFVRFLCVTVISVW